MPPCCRALCEDTTVEKQILILLAAYKGGRFIRPMVDSILAQDVGAEADPVGRWGGYRPHFAGIRR